ncbi:Aryl-sulfate sulfotransferase [Lentibacillus sp. JNUCC-1]|uniref:aryl-sulfate sulfotransferase n=1 Tax=Lentibacillus sp. JNUCC-1 TaxID=2654513 RepID=UPI0012E75034|nr:aryl-sulfate sulfotransferase [Lentibacillus sp. JNUCC-1]MUV37329.1 Aryl-sulfate sulfotransferase [Lentibacillus sp. JNUCC-1]
MNKKIWTIIGAVLAIGVIALTAVLIGNNSSSDQATDDEKPSIQKEPQKFNPEPDPNAKQVTTYHKERITDQEAIEKQLEKDFNPETHTLKDPFIKLDPYGVAPLTALVKFTTETPAEITLTVQGNDKESTIQKVFEGYNTKHSIPVYGLYADKNNTVTLEATTEDGDDTTTELTIQTEPLPEDFLQVDLVEAQPDKMEPGLTFINPSSRYTFGVDHNADVRWYSTLWNSHVFKRLENGHILYITKEEGQEKYNDLLEMNLLGKVYNAYLFDIGEYDKTNVVHHDVIELPTGNLLATTHDTESEYIEDEMVEIDRETGKTVRNFSFQDIFPEEFYKDYDGALAEDGDWFHQNAVWFDDSDNSLIISSRHQDLEMKMTYPEGDIKWILAAHEEWPESFNQYLLEPTNGAVKFPGGPHAPMTMPDQDNNPDTLDMIYFDNNHVITRGDEKVSGEYSRAVQVRINEKDMTVEEIWSYGEERGRNLFSKIVGDADYLPETKNRLMTTGYIAVEEGEDPRNSRIIEVIEDEPAKVLYEIVISGFDKDSHRQAYRAERMEVYEGE